MKDLKMRSFWISQVGPKFSEMCSHKRRKMEEDHVKMEAEGGAVQLQAKCVSFTITVTKYLT
jgi:hypothetical protein